MNKNSANYWYNRVNKLVLGQSVTIPDFGVVTYYAKSECGRKFKLSNMKCGVAAGGNRPLATVRKSLDSVYC